MRIKIYVYTDRKAVNTYTLFDMLVSIPAIHYKFTKNFIQPNC